MFDPDKYIAEKQGFNPDGYLQEKQNPVLDRSVGMGDAEREALRISDQLGRGEITQVEAVAQATALGINDILNEYIIEPVAQVIPDGVKQSAGAAVETFVGLPGVSHAIDTYDTFAESNPRAADNIEAVATIGGTLAAGAGSGKNLATKAYKGIVEPDIKKAIKAGDLSGEIATKQVNSIGITTTDPIAKKLVDNGVEPGVVQELKLVSDAPPKQPNTRLNQASSGGTEIVPYNGGRLPLIEQTPKASTTKQRLLKMLETKRQGLNKPSFRRRHRASGVLGESVMDRFRFIMKKNKEAAQKIKPQVQALKGKPVDMRQPFRSFEQKLVDMGIKSEDGVLDFTDSILDGVKPAEKVTQQVVSKVIKMLDEPGIGGNVDAYRAHILKRQIDELVTYGKHGEGLAGEAELILKQLRHDINEQLKSQFKKYGEVNTQYADTIAVLDEFQKAAGKTTNLLSEYGNESAGTLMRRLTSNAQSRGRVQEALDLIETTAAKYGGRFSDELDPQITLVNELDRLFGESAETSMGGIMQTSDKIQIGIEAASGQGGLQTASKLAQKLGQRDVSKVQKETFEALQEIIEKEY